MRQTDLIFILVILLFGYTNCFGQKALNNLRFSVFYGRHFNDKIHYTQGESRLLIVPAKAVSASLTKDLIQDGHWELAPGLMVHLYLESDGYGIDYPSGNNSGFFESNHRTFNHTRTSLSLPLLGAYNLELNSTDHLNFRSGPIFSTYFYIYSVSRHRLGYQDENYNNILVFESNTYYDDWTSDRSKNFRQFTKPKLEWVNELGFSKEFQHVGELELSIRHVYGSQKVSQTYFNIYIPEQEDGSIPGQGEFEKNNSYMGLALTYTFLTKK